MRRKSQATFPAPWAPRVADSYTLGAGSVKPIDKYQNSPAVELLAQLPSLGWLPAMAIRQAARDNYKSQYDNYRLPAVAACCMAGEVPSTCRTRHVGAA